MTAILCLPLGRGEGGRLTKDMPSGVVQPESMWTSSKTGTRPGEDGAVEADEDGMVLTKDRGA